MQTPHIFEQLTQGMGDPKKVGQWLQGAWAMPAGADATTASTKAWIGSVESMLAGAESLRNMQLETIHRTQQRIAGLAKTLGTAHAQADTASALQTFAQENLQDAVKYWSAYQEIVQKAEMQLLEGAAKASGQKKAAAKTAAAK